MAQNIITLREAGRRLRPDRPLTPQRVRQLVSEYGYKLHELNKADRRIKVGVTPQAVTALKRRRAIAKRRV